MSAREEYAITMTAREKAELLPVEPDARPLGAQEIRGRTIATLVSAGTELAAAYQASSFPRTCGYAAVFEVEGFGAEVGGIKAGDKVFCMGPHRSFQRILRGDAIPLPPGLPPNEALFARMMNVSMSTLTTTTARPPQKVLVTGLGLVGHLAAKVFAICGYDVIACDPSETRRKIAEEAGIRPVYPSVPLQDASIVGKVALVVECSGHEGAVIDGCRAVQKRGEVVLVGVPWRKCTDKSAHELADAIFHKYAVVRSGWEWEVSRQPSEFRTGSMHENIAAAMRWLAEGRLKVDNLYALAPPRDAQRVYQDLLHARWPKLAAIFDWAECP